MEWTDNKKKWFVLKVFFIQSGAWALDKSFTRPSFFLYFWEIKKKRSHWPGGQSDPSQIPRLYNCYNLCPCARRAHVGKCGPRVRVQVLQYSGSGTSGMVVLRFTTLFARDRHWRNPRKKNNRERSNKKSAGVSALAGLVPRKMAEARQSVSTLIRNRTHIAQLSATYLNH